MLSSTNNSFAVYATVTAAADAAVDAIGTASIAVGGHGEAVLFDIVWLLSLSTFD